MKEMNVGRLPGRKLPVLWIEENGVVRPLAYFTSRSAMEEFLSLSPTYVAPPAAPAQLREAVGS